MGLVARGRFRAVTMGQDRNRAARPHVSTGLSDPLALWRATIWVAHRRATPSGRAPQRPDRRRGDPGSLPDGGGKTGRLQLVPRILDRLIQEGLWGPLPYWSSTTGGICLSRLICRISSVRALVPLETQYLLPSVWDDNPLSPNFGAKFLIWRTTPHGDRVDIATEIHQDRLLVYPGIRDHRPSAAGASGLGDSIYWNFGGPLQQWGAAVEGTPPPGTKQNFENEGPRRNAPGPARPLCRRVTGQRAF